MSRVADSPQYGKIPYDAVKAGLVASLDQSELRVYVVIAAHVDGRTWTARLSVHTIAKLAGRSVRTVQRTEKRLREKHAIYVKLGGGRHRTNEYTVVTNPDALRDALSRAETPSPCVTPNGDENPVAQRDTVSQEKPRQSDPNTPSNPDGNPVKRRPKPRQPGDTRTAEQQEQQNSRVADAADAVADPRSQEVREDLEKIGITDPVLSKLVQDPSVTRHCVRSWWIVAKHRDRVKDRTGFVVKALTDRWELPADELRAARNADRFVQDAKRRAERATAEALGRAAFQARFDQIPEEQLPDLAKRAAVIAQERYDKPLLKPPRVLRRHDLREDGLLMPIIIELWDEQPGRSKQTKLEDG